MRTMFDSTTAADIPSWAPIVAGYVDGLYAWSAADWARFPAAVKVRIAVFASTDDGHVGDFETGNSPLAEWPGWASRRRAAGVDPSLYFSQSLWDGVRAEFQAQGVAEPHYWIANWDGLAVLPQGAVAKQYANPDLSGGHYDLSIVADYWPGVDGGPGGGPGGGPAPPPAPPPQPPEDEDVILVHFNDGTGIFLLSGGLLAHVPSDADVAALTAAGVKVASPVSGDLHQALAAQAQALQGKISGSLGVQGTLAVG